MVHLTSSSEIKVSWREMIELGRKIIRERMPLNGVVWFVDQKSIRVETKYSLRICSLGIQEVQ